MKKFIRKELIYGARNYLPEEVCIKRGRGIYLTDVYNKKYMDFISAYSAVNMGHCHPRLIQTMKLQMSQLTLTSRAIYNNILGEFMEKICTTFRYDRVLPMNTGVEGGETAIKIARKWGYNVKNVPKNQAVNLFCENNFWGRTLAAASSSSDPLCYQDFGPYMAGFDMVKYNCLDSLELKFKTNPNIVSFMFEPIQGEAGIIVPDSGYISRVRELCNTYNVLMIADEVQTGMGRTGKMIACDHEIIKPDILVLGKALSGGMLPLSAVLADNHTMDNITPGTHGSTFGGNPLAAAVGIESINITLEEKLCENSLELGEYFRNVLADITKSSNIKVRGKGLMNAMELPSKEITKKLIRLLIDHGLLVKSTHENIIRLAPPLIINKDQIDYALAIIDFNLNKLK